MKNYKAKYLFLREAVNNLIISLKDEIYQGKISTSALKYASDMKYYLLCAENQGEKPECKKAKVKSKRKN